MVMKNKRGLSLPPELMVILVILVFVLLIILVWFPGSFLGQTEAIGIVSVPANALIIKQCNAYCASLKGEVSDSVIEKGGDVRYLYCLYNNPFRTDKNKKNPMNCLDASKYESGKLGIRNCSNECK